MNEQEALLIGEIKANVDRCFGRLEKLEHEQETLHSLALSVEKLVGEVKRSNTRLGLVEEDVKALSGRDGKRWDSLVDKAIWLIAGALISFAIKQIGLG